MNVRMWIACCTLIALLLVAPLRGVADESGGTRPILTAQPQDGYRGLWAAGPATPGESRYLWVGGCATGLTPSRPIAIHAAAVGRTFFLYAGQTASEKGEPALMISYFDHKNGTVPRPRLLPAHSASPLSADGSLAMDAKGIIWVFQAGASGGKGRVLRGSKPYEIDTFEVAAEFPMTVPQAWCLEDNMLALIYTEPGEQGGLAFRSSHDGAMWSPPTILVRMGAGSDYLSGSFKNKLGVVFNVRPEAAVDSPTNLYGMESLDGGKTWQTIDKKPLELPLTQAKNPALVKEYQSIRRLTFLSDFFLDSRGNPVVMFIMSSSAKPGPAAPPRKWITARWTGREWDTAGILRTLSNYDRGALYVESADLWRFIAPTAPAEAPQKFAPGNEMIEWSSQNQGRSWAARLLTNRSEFNHNHVRRPVNAAPDFYALWCDGDGRQPSPCRLYFADDAFNVFQLPVKMSSDNERPVAVPLSLADPGTQPAAQPVHNHPASLPR